MSLTALDLSFPMIDDSSSSSSFPVQFYLWSKGFLCICYCWLQRLFVSTTAPARATTPLSFASLHRRTPPSVAVPTRRRRQTRGLGTLIALSLVRWRYVHTSHTSVFPVAMFSPGWRCASAAVPDPVPSEEPASASASTVVVTEKPAAAAEEEKCEEAGAVEATVAAPPVSSEVSEEDGGIDDILSKLDIEVTPTYVLYGSGAFVVLWILSSVVSAIDSIPLLPQVLELVGIGYSIWFTARYLLFKENRDELFAKFEDLKGRII